MRNKDCDHSETEEDRELNPFWPIGTLYREL
jgi:hypothetical protein